jgi:hypothetical protein
MQWMTRVGAVCVRTVDHAGQDRLARGQQMRQNHAVLMRHRRQLYAHIPTTAKA